jgi:hypothetical protein
VALIQVLPAPEVSHFSSLFPPSHFLQDPCV